MNRFWIKLSIIIIVGLLLLMPINGILFEQDTCRSISAEESASNSEGTPITIEKGINKLLENEYLAIYMDSSNAGIEVEDKQSGLRWRTNPSDSGASSNELLSSQINLRYYNDKDEEMDFNSYTDAVAKNQYSVSYIGNGVRVDYRIGEEVTIRLIPEAMIKEKFEEIVLSNVSDDAIRRKILRYYRFISLAEEDEADRPDLLKKYPILSEQDIYVLRPLLEHEKVYMEEFFIGVGYTFDDMEKDTAATGITGALTKAPPLFNIPIEYVLEGKSLVVRIPAAQIKYNTEDYILNSINVLPYFSAGHKDEEGYLLLPDGSGSIIDFAVSANKDNYLTSKRVYGHDNNLNKTYNASVEEDIRLPVYGVSKSQGALFTIIETGDAIADIIYEIPGFLHEYASASSKFYLRTREEYTYSDSYSLSAAWSAYEKDSYQEDINLRYLFLSKENNGYPGMANAYRDYLIGNGVLDNKIADDGVPLFMETLGYIEKNRNFGGIPYKDPVALTTFEQASAMVQRFQDEGINDLSIRYQGWINGGMNSTVPNRIKVDSVIGGNKGLKKFQESMASLGVDLFFDADFMTVQKNNLFDGFTPGRDSSRNLDKRYAGMYDSNKATNMKDLSTFRFLVSPKSTSKYLLKFTTLLENYKISNLSAGTIGKYLQSDFNVHNQINREEAKGIIVQALSKINASEGKLMVDGGNAYALPYADYIADIPMWDSGYNIFDECVPFYQMVIHGYIQYSGQSLNSSSDYTTELLRTIETGAYPAYMTVADNENELKDTAYSSYYSLNYDKWEEIIIRDFKLVKPLLSRTNNKCIIGHSKVLENVFQTAYEDGLAVLVNYGSSDAEIDGVKVPARGYVLLENGTNGAAVISEYSWRANK